ncbi:MAG: polysaccharide deacetylase family protein [Limisphaerales bacterium]
MSLKRRISPHLHRVGLATGISAMMARRQGGMRILMYHGVGTNEFPTQTFVAGLRFLRRKFNVVPLLTIIKKVLAGDPGTGREVALTFDDGLRNNFTILYPILQRVETPATFFVVPGVVERNEWIWTHDARERLLSLSDVDCYVFAGELQAPDSDCPGIIEWMKKVPNKQRLEIHQRIRERTKKFVPTPFQREQFDLMTWDELNSLDPRLITIGSHSMNHPILSMISENEIETEIAGSRRLLEERLQRPVEYFCYPNGDYDNKIVAAVRKTYTAAIAVRSKAVGNGDDPHCLPRVSAATEPDLLAWRLHRPTA